MLAICVTYMEKGFADLIKGLILEQKVELNAITFFLTKGKPGEI